MGGVDEKDLRVSDAEREHIGQLLQRAVGQGYISIAEFGERMDQAMAARTRGELNAVVIDLPGMRLHAEAREPVPASPLAQPIPGSGPGQGSVLLRERFGTLTRKGSWTVPGRIELRTLCSDVTLDFTSARLASPVLHIAIDDKASTIVLIVNENTTVDTSAVETIAGTVTTRITPSAAAPRLAIMVSGKLWFGTLKVRHPRGTTLRRMLGS
ncbi:DUF1707 SHOCT-like domain-containing protein [Lolliginicoccus suaedae]|uniref:DUF1707 SHOCT-like domain-containing protein n=1 Tax=Lolliginicoccus suaedae TaxID=2605429 RepID=UPI001F43231A|nr:DUF1707 domain-containing protein [Lolliginicoccus suaedae]